MDVIKKYFPDLTSAQLDQFEQLLPLYSHWNEQINVISRKDIHEMYVRHVLHSLALLKVSSFDDGTKFLDIGTGGGFPGIPLAIMLPECSFRLVDSIGKKIKVVKAVSEALELKNVSAHHERAEQAPDKYHYILNRAVTRLQSIIPWIKGRLITTDPRPLANGILSYKGGDLKEELKEVRKSHKVYQLSDFFDEPFFETKCVIHTTI